MDKKNNSTVTPMVELNKLIAEKQTIIIQQKTRIKAYKREIQRLEKEAANNNEQDERYQQQIERTKILIKEKNEEYDRLVQHGELMRWKIDQIEREIDETNNETEKLREEFDSSYHTHMGKFNELKDIYLSSVEGYAEPKALEQGNQELQKEIDELTVEYDELEKIITQEDEDLRKLEEMEEMKAEVDALEQQYEKLNKTYLRLIIIDSESYDVNKAPVPAPAVEERPSTSNMEIAPSQDQKPNLFNVPNVPDKICDLPFESLQQQPLAQRFAPRKVNIIQNLSFPYTLTKHKSDENISKMVQEKKSKIYGNIPQTNHHLFEQDIGEQTHPIEQYSQLFGTNQTNNMFSPEYVPLTGDDQCMMTDIPNPGSNTDMWTPNLPDDENILSTSFGPNDIFNFNSP